MGFTQRALRGRRAPGEMLPACPHPRVLLGGWGLSKVSP